MGNLWKKAKGTATPRPAWVRRTLFLLPFISAPFLAGCRNCHMVEAELRKQETENRHLHEQLEHMEAVNNGLMRELYGTQIPPGALGALGAPTSTAKPPPDQTAPIAGLKEIALGRGTGGIDDDKIPGDEALQVVLEPRDVDGHTVKVPGTLQVNVLEVTTEGMKIQIGSWEIPPEKLRKTWKSGFMTTGYVVVLPWQKWPSST